jgi:hypothetical protein
MSSGNSNTNNGVRGYLGSHHRGYGGGGGHPPGQHGRHQGNGPLSSPRGSFDNGGSVPSRSCVVGDNNLFHYGRGGNVNNGGQRIILAGPSGSGGNGLGLNQGIGNLGNNVPHRSGKLNNYPVPTQKDREMSSIYGTGESSDGVGGGDNILRSNSFGGGINLALLGGPTAGGGKRKQHANPCRFAGHDHDWKDCPNNFRNKKRAKVMSGRGNIGMLDDTVAVGGSGGCAGMMIKEEWEPSTGRRSSTMNNVVVRGVSMMVMHHGNNIHSPSERGGGGVGDGSAVLVTQSDHGGLIPGHYGPASSSSASDVNNSIGRMNERPNLVDRCGTSASGSFGGGVGSESRGYRPAKERGISCSIGGERGYDIVASERGYRSGLERTHDINAPPASLSKPLTAQRKSFAEDTVQSHDGAGTGEVGMRRNSPYPGMVGERQRSSHHQGHSRRVAVSLPGLLPTSQQMPSLNVSLKNERGYSLTAPSGASNTQLLKRGLSTPGGFSVGRDCPAGRDEQKLFRDIPPPPPVLSTSLDLGWGDHSLSSPGEIHCVEQCGREVEMGGTAPIPSFRSSPPPFCGNAKSLSVDIAATALSKDDSLYADLASPSPWYTLRVAASQGELGMCDSHASPNKMANERMGHDCDDHAFCGPSFHGDSTQAEVLSPLSPTPLLRYSSSEAVATITNDNADVKEKEAKLLPLTCASLGGADKVRKAEDIVAAMVKLADFNAFFSGDGVGVPLPSKIQITKAMSILENKIKFKSKEATCMRKDVIAIQAAEKEEEEHITILAKIEEEHITEEEALLTTDAEDRVRKCRLGREKNVSARQVTLTNLSKSCCSVLQKKRETEIVRMTETFQLDMDSKDSTISFQITLICHQLHEVEKQMRIIISSPSSGLIPEELKSENDTTHDGTGIPTYDFPGRMSELVGRIVNQNRKVAKKAHLNVFECMPYFPIAGGMINSLAKTATLLLKNKEWSNRARSVTNLYDALYNEPTKVPQYQNSNENFIEIALLVKECIRMKDAKLSSRWATISEHYVLRQAMYHDQTANASDCERGGYSISAGFHHDRGSEYYDVMNNKESSTSSTPGGGGGNLSQSDSAVRGNNPYRSRPRRGISPGDVVRSDYEQEQIIAEIAAKEAMEKRIKEGGCPLPRQRCCLESVSTLMLMQFVFLRLKKCSNLYEHFSSN